MEERVGERRRKRFDLSYALPDWVYSLSLL
jgi:hypothetical protein